MKRNIQIDWKKWITFLTRRVKLKCRAVWQRVSPKSSHQLPKDDFKRYRRFHRELAKNPYLQSKALWYDMYGSIQIKLENSYRIIFILSCVIAVALIGLVVIAGETKVKPFVTVIHGNEVFTIDQPYSQKENRVQPQLAGYFIKNFIRDARSVSADAMINAEHRMAAYSYLSDSAVDVLKDYYRHHDPNTIAKRQVRSVAITSVLQESAHGFTVRWQEELRSTRTGKLLGRQNYIAEMTYRYQHPSTEAIVLRHNPLGFYITHLSWSLDQAGDS